MVSKHVYLLGMDSVMVIGRSRGAIVPDGRAAQNGMASPTIISHCLLPEFLGKH